MNTTKRHQEGILLLEVLFSILIFSFGILGLLGLQAISTQNSVSAEDRNIASTLASDLVAQMYMRKTSRTVPDASPAVGANPTALATDIAAWQTRVTTSGLPNASGTVTVDGAGITTISIVWKANSKTTNSRYQTQIVI